MQTKSRAYWMFLDWCNGNRPLRGVYVFAWPLLTMVSHAGAILKASCLNSTRPLKSKAAFSFLPAKEMSIFNTERLLTIPVSTGLWLFSENNRWETLGCNRRPREMQEQASGFCTSIPMYMALFTLKPGCLHACECLFPCGKSTLLWQAE